MIGLQHYLTISAILFSLSVAGISENQREKTSCGTCSGRSNLAYRNLFRFLVVVNPQPIVKYIHLEHTRNEKDRAHVKEQLETILSHGQDLGLLLGPFDNGCEDSAIGMVYSSKFFEIAGF